MTEYPGAPVARVDVSPARLPRPMPSYSGLLFGWEAQQVPIRMQVLGTPCTSSTGKMVGTARMRFNGAWKLKRQPTSIRLMPMRLPSPLHWNRRPDRHG